MLVPCVQKQISNKNIMQSFKKGRGREREIALQGRRPGESSIPAQPSQADLRPAIPLPQARRPGKAKPEKTGGEGGGGGSRGGRGKQAPAAQAATAAERKQKKRTGKQGGTKALGFWRPQLVGGSSGSRATLVQSLCRANNSCIASVE